ncbi:hypothetical protein [Amycolatopsis magusensis]|uniref:hypothetical protein n=1 Tax=Amycolatopsis magusensis TaxID=882444 RepID=UPI0037A68580
MSSMRNHARSRCGSAASTVSRSRLAAVSSYIRNVNRDTENILLAHAQHEAIHAARAAGTRPGAVDELIAGRRAEAIREDVDDPPE